MVFKIVLAVIFDILFVIWLIVRKAIKGMLLDCKNGTDKYIRYFDPSSVEKVKRMKENMEKGSRGYKRLCAIFLINI